jgi:hypothetical protein
VKRTALVLAILALSACQSPPSAPVPSVSNGPTSFLVTMVDGIQLSLAGTAGTTTSLDPTCASEVFELKTTGGEYEVASLLPGCTATTAIPENGNHGFYPAAPPTALVDRVATPVGDAVLFSNQYSDCSSSCYMGTDEVALVAVGSHVVQVIALTAPANGTTARDRAELVAVLQGLRRA